MRRFSCIATWGLETGSKEARANEGSVKENSYLIIQQTLIEVLAAVKWQGLLSGLNTRLTVTGRRRDLGIDHLGPV